MTIRIVRGLLVAGVLLAVGARAMVAQQGPADTPGLVASPDAPGFLEGDAIPDIFLSPSTGAVSTQVLNGATGALMGAGAPFGGFGGGTRIAVGDLTGDGVPDIVAGMGPGGGLVSLIDGVTLASLGGGYPFGPAFGGGVSVAVGDVSGDGRNDIIVGQASGGGAVSVFNGVNYTPVLSASPFGGGYGGGVHVAAGDIDADGRADLIVGQASGGVVSIVNGASGAVVASGVPFGSANGVFVAAGDVTSDGRAEAIVAPGSGNGPVLVFNIATLTVVGSFTPFPGNFSGGVRVAATDLSGDGRVEILAVPGPGIAPIVRVYDGATFANTADYAFSSEFAAVGAMVAAPASTGIRFTSANTVRFATGAASSFTVRASGFPAVTSITMTGALPSGLTFTNNGNGTATLSGITATAGTFPLTFTASNGRTTAQQSFTLRTAQVPAFTTSANATFALGLSNTFTITATGSPVPTITRAGTLPAGVTFTGGVGSATLSGTPAPGTVGTYALTFTAASGAESATQDFVLTVRDGPVFTSPDTVSFTAGVAGSFTVTTQANPPVTTISRVGGQPPAGMTFVDNGNGTATLSGTPTAAGTFAMDLAASNGQPSVGMQTLTVSVRQAPSITSATSTTFNLNTPGSFLVTATGFPTPTVSFTGTLPAGVSFSSGANGTATISGTPTGTPGAFPLTITAANGAGTNATQNFTLIVAGAPAFTSAAATTFVAGTPGNFLVTASGGPAPTIGLSGTLPAGVTFVNNGNGTATLAGTPGAGTGGTFPLTLTASNGIGSPATQNFTLTVNRAPAFTSLNSTSFTVNTPSSFTVTTSAVPTATVSLTAGTLPAGITFTPNGNGTATIAGTATANGTSNLTLQASNGVGTPATQAFSLTITSCVIVNVQPASGALPAGTISTGYTQAITATGGSGHTFAVTAGTLPGGLTLSSGGSLAGTPNQTGNFNFTVTATAAGTGCQGSAAYSLAIAPNATSESFNNGVGNTQYSVGAGTPGTPAVVSGGSVLSNDAGSGTLTAGPSSIATTNGGQVAMNANGSFLYTPAAGFAGPSDTFTYTLTDGNGMTDTAVVTINMSGVVWYVNSAAAPGGTGRSHQPFNTMTAAASAAQVNQVIYVHPGSPSGATVLKANQTLRGAGESFTLNGLTIAAGATPTLSGTVTLASDVAVRALNVTAGGAVAVSGNALTGSSSLTNVALSSSVSALSLTGAAGTFTASGGSIVATGAGTAVAMNGGTAAITISSPVTSAAGRSVSIQNRTGGSVTFNGAVTDGGGGVLLDNNGGASIGFAGGLAITTDGVTGFTATGGGTITATQNNTSVVNFISTDNATALNVTNTQIGGAGLTFRSIRSVAGAGTGIILDGTGTSGGNGGLTVTGNGTAMSGGRIATKTGANGSLTTGVGIYLNNTRNATFNRMQLSNFENSGIAGRNVDGFLMSDSAITGAGTAVSQFEGPVVFGTTSVNGLSGTATFRNTPISGGFEHNLAVYGQSGTMAVVIERTTLVLSDCLIEATGANGGHAINVQLDGSAAGSLTISQCRLRSFSDAAIHAVARGSSSLALNATGIGVVNNGQGQRGIVVTNGENALLAATVSDSSFENLTGPAIQFGQVPLSASAASLLRMTISNNDMYSSQPTTPPSILGAMSSTPGQAARTRVLLADTYVEHHGLLPGVLFHVPDAGATPAVDITVARTHLDMLEVNTPGDNGPTGLLVRNLNGGTICTNVGPNTFHWVPIGLGTGGGVVLERGGSSTFTLERGTSSLATPASTVLATANGPHSGGPAPGPPDLPGSTTSVIGTITVVENNSCILPSAP